MRDITSIDYITNLVLSIIDLNDDIIKSSGEITDLIIERDVLYSTYKSTKMPQLDSDELYTYKTLIIILDESMEDCNDYISKHMIIKNMHI